jgi:hypothetical protein
LSDPDPDGDTHRDVESNAHPLAHRHCRGRDGDTHADQYRHRNRNTDCDGIPDADRDADQYRDRDRDTDCYGITHGDCDADQYHECNRDPFADQHGTRFLRVADPHRYPTGVVDAHAHSDTYCHGIVHVDSDEHPNGHYRTRSG